MTKAASTFTIESWEATPYDEAEGATLTRTKVTKVFSGEIEGTSTAELLMAGAQDGSAAYVGFERIVGRVNGREGTFLLHHSATMTKDAQSASWTVVPDSGTGELRNLRGSAQIAVDSEGGHTLVLEYEVE